MKPPIQSIPVRYAEAAELMYAALNVMPCICEWRWVSPVREEKTKVCRRCRALAQWDALR